MSRGASADLNGSTPSSGGWCAGSLATGLRWWHRWGPLGDHHDWRRRELKHDARGRAPSEATLNLSGRHVVASVPIMSTTTLVVKVARTPAMWDIETLRFLGACVVCQAALEFGIGAACTNVAKHALKFRRAGIECRRFLRASAERNNGLLSSPGSCRK